MALNGSWNTVHIIHFLEGHKGVSYRSPQLQPPWHLVQVMTDLLGVFSAVGRYLSDEG